MAADPLYLIANVTSTLASTMNSVPVTTPIPPKTSPSIGYICASIAVIFYGSNFVPVKKYETGDGMFFQWILCSGIFMVGLVINIIQKSVFYPLAMVGGVIWCTGNLCVVPILKTIGLSIGLCLWATANLLAGWFSARFGMFGIKKEIPGDEVMNYLSIVFAVVSAFLYSLIKSNISTSPTIEQIVDDPDYETGISQTTASSNSLVSAVESETIYVVQTNNTPRNQEEDLSFFEKLPPVKKRLLGITLAIFSGILYGLNFTPAIYIQDRFHDSSQNGLDYVFAHFCGIFMTSTIYFVCYAIYKRNKPKIYSSVILPGLASGIMWAAATTCFFVANSALSEPISFPIINTGPALIASFWGVVVFKEITGRTNLSILMFAFSMTITTGVLAGLSKSSS